jgi:hypothetical protein
MDILVGVLVRVVLVVGILGWGNWLKREVEELGVLGLVVVISCVQ